MAESYFIIPHRLDVDERYAKLSIKAKYLYGKMRDILKLSIKNNWVDDNGFYIRMTRAKMSDLLQCSLPTVRKVVKELIAADLLDEKREGLTRSNRLYVHVLHGEDEIAFQCGVITSAPSTRKPAFTLDGNTLSPNQRNLSQRQNQPTETVKDPVPKYSASENNRSYPTLENMKKEFFWEIKEGSIFRYQGAFWSNIKGEILPYRFGEDLKKATIDLLLQFGMSPEDIPRAMAMCGEF